MAVVVQKFGGSSVADLERLGRVADRVASTRSEGHDVVVVVSAMGKTTDQLLALAQGVSPSPPRRELDMLLSVGERITMALVAIALQRRGVDAISFTGSQSGIITNDRHFDARIIEVRPFRIEDELSRGRVVIVAGYQGMSYRREITTLGRGGSDTTAVALAAALGADRCEIYSDVDGVYSADPKVVPNAVHLPSVGYDVLREMAEAGARVLNAEAVAFARRERIAIHARRTSDPIDSSGRETVVHHPHRPAGTAVTAVVGERNIAWIEGDGDGLEGLLRALGAADEHNVPWRSLSYERGRFTAGIALARVPDWTKASAALGREGFRVSDPTDTDATAGLALVGDGVSQDGAVLREALAQARSEGVDVQGVTLGPFHCALRVPAGALDPLTRRLHARFCEP